MGTIFSTSCLVAWVKISSEVPASAKPWAELLLVRYCMSGYWWEVQPAISREEDDLR
jgi:hypothetical protein